MKRKIVGILLVLALSVGTTACTNMNADFRSTEGMSKESSVSQSTEDGKGGQGAGQQVVDDGSKNQGQAVLSDGRENILFPGYFADVYYGVDSNGNKLSEYRWKDVCEELKQHGMNFDNAVMSAMGDDAFYVYQYEMMEDRNGYHVYAINAKSLEVVSLWTSEEGWWLESIDYYQGKVYITAYSDGAGKKELIYVKDKESFSFQSEENPNMQFIQSMKDFNLTLSSVNLGNRYGCCSITRVLDEAGFVIGSLDDQYYQFTKDGLVNIIPGISEYVYIQGYDEDGIVYSKFDDETLTNDLYGVNLKTGENLLIAKGENDSNKELLGYADGKAYYCISKENPFVLKTNTVYQFQFDSGESRMLYQKESIPGATDVQPGTQSFQLVDGKIYVVMPNGMELRWMKVDPDASAVIFQDQNLVVGEKNIFKYGTVVTDSYILNCPFCGIPLEKYYGEEFQLDARYSAYADDINKKLSNELHDLVQRNLEEFDQLGSTDEECGDHQENPIIYCVTIENEVGNIAILSDRYLTIDYSGYWYGGGVHGMPSAYQRTFDLKTGAEVNLSSFYDGSEESFKKLVAEKTKEDFLSYDEGETPYFAETAEQVYEDAYKYANLYSGNVFFEEKGITFLYSPYDMGPYASGFISIFISYQELLGRDNL
ncbi:MAG: DUF3298 domain-containing protein [Lachnospiraceae bacterium]|nr:DUF3298 domain-containing protein [Lachnospiraceae bacterium]MBR4608462.1 DUF3298 domain-containing protein [Lachnospiraceae bacterium]